MWLTSSSIGRKLVMAITGVCLVLFVTFHVLMNAVCIFWPTAYNQICEFLGANWYALIASAGLALLFIIHIIYACWLTLQNKKARGNDPYKVTSRPPQVEWSSKNMLVLGLVIVAFLIVHLVQFWYKMQYQEMMHHELSALPTLEGAPVPPALGTIFIQMAFSQIWTVVVYIIGFIALWFHMNHGFWSMFHTVGWDNNIWINRLKTIGCWWTSIVVGLFIIQAVVFTVLAQKNYYTENTALQEQYGEYWDEQANVLAEDFQSGFMKSVDISQMDRMQIQNAQQDYIVKEGPAFVAKAEGILSGAKKFSPDVALEGVNNLEQFAGFVKSNLPAGSGLEEEPAAPADNNQSVNE